MTNPTTVSPLRQRMIEDMTARGLGQQTQRGHVRACKRFAAYLKRSPETATAEDVRLFQLHLMESGLTIQNRNRTMTGLRFLLRVTMRRLDLAEQLVLGKVEARAERVDAGHAVFFAPDEEGNAPHARRVQRRLVWRQELLQLRHDRARLRRQRELGDRADLRARGDPQRPHRQR